MSDYTQVNDYSAKDALSSGNPLKTIKGSDVDAEFAAISAAIATKFDTTSIASAGEAQAGTSNTVVMTPGRVTSWSQAQADLIEDIWTLADPDADNLLFWDDSASGMTWLTLGTGLSITGTVLSASGDLTAIVLTAGSGLSYSVGGTDLSASATIDLDITELTGEAAIASADVLAFYDATATANRKITFGELETALGLAGAGTYALAARTLTAGAGLAGGGDLSADRTFDVNITAETELAAVPADDDELLISDTSATNEVKKITVANAIGTQLGEARLQAASAQALSAATETDVAFGTSSYDNLQRGTWSTPNYTAGASGATVLVTVSVTADTLGSGASLEVRIYGAGAAVAHATDFNQADSSSNACSVQLSAVVNLSASQVVKVTAETSSAESLATGIQTTLSIVELG